MRARSKVLSKNTALAPSSNLSIPHPLRPHSMTFLLVTMKPKKISQKRKPNTHRTSHITRALKEVFHTYAISPKSHHGLDELIEHYLDEIYESSDEEIEFVFYAILEEFIQSQGQSVPLDYTTLKVIWNNTIHTKKSFTLALIPCMHDAIESCRELLSEKKEVSYHAIVKELTTPLHDKVLSSAVKSMRISQASICITVRFLNTLWSVSKRLILWSWMSI